MHQGSILHIVRIVVSAGRRTTSKQFASHHISSSRAGREKIVHEIIQEDDMYTVRPEEQNGSFDVVCIKYINLDSVESVIFTN